MPVKSQATEEVSSMLHIARTWHLHGLGERGALERSMRYQKAERGRWMRLKERSPPVVLKATPPVGPHLVVAPHAGRSLWIGGTLYPMS